MIEKAVRRALKTPGWMSEEQLFFLGNQALGKDLVVEVGVWRGRVTTVLSSVAKRVLAVDTWRGVKGVPRDGTGKIVETIGSDALFTEYCLRFTDEIQDGRVTPIRISSVNAREIMSVYMRGQKADMIFIDADHLGLAADLEVFAPMVKEGGILCGDDYHERWPEVIRDVKENVPGFQHGPGAIWWKAV